LDLNVTDLAFACGSGGTAAGLALGSYLYSKHFTDEKCLVHDGRDTCKPPIHAYIVCDKDEYFYQHIDNIIFPEMGVPEEISSRHLMQITNAQGTGYARTTTQELVFIQQVAQETGIFLDPVYSGKALYHLIQDLNRMPDKFVGRTILFIHTGGFFGLYDKVDQLKLLLRKNQIERFYMD
jgi:1-aminocyclopropane-1-carboxylate deaminase/D-cysteine desulfhydrase-like pyridoxal-dependent ACC family enzyme